MKGVPFKGPFSLPPAMGKSHFGFSRARIKVTVQARAASGLLSLCSQLQSMVCRVAVWLLGHMVGEHRSWNKQVQRNRTGARGIREKEFFVSDIYQDFLFAVASSLSQWSLFPRLQASSLHHSDRQALSHHYPDFSHVPIFPFVGPFSQ